MYRNHILPFGLCTLSLLLAGCPSPGAELRYELSSGLFSIPADAKSVDWSVLNNTAETREVRITVYQVGVGTPKEPVAPGPLKIKIGPFQASHNANSVGHDQPFKGGYYYEVVVETNSLKVLPSVQVWSDLGNTVIPGTLIGPGQFVDMTGR
jgi:hypothetical protein